MNKNNLKKIPVYEPTLDGNELKYVTECIRTNWVSSNGRFVSQFEDNFSQYCGVKYGVATANGTVALHLALVTLEIGPSDEVILPTLTFVATASTILHAGAIPVFVDSNKENWNIDPEKIEEKITSNTKAIVVVHLYGHPVDMDAILAVARNYNLYVIEDAAEAHGAEYKGKKVGGLGDMSCFSFYGNKIITTGEGGMVLTDDPKLAQRARILRDHGMSPTRRYWHPEIGYNYRLTNLQAAVGVAQLEKIEKILRKKRDIAQKYNHLLAEVEGIVLPPEEKWAKNVYWMYSILVTDEYGISRDELMTKLMEENIESRPFFYPIHEMPPYKHDEESFPVAEELSRRGLNLPSAFTLADEDIVRICEVIRQR